MRYALVACALILSAQIEPELHLVPPKLVLKVDSLGFAQGRVQVLNRGGEPLQIRRVIPSCNCASATVLKNPVHPLEVGEILLRINTNDWRDSIGVVEFEIESNTTPVRYPVTVHRRH